MTQRHYLLIDDNRAFVENVAEILSDLGAQVTIAATPQEALALAAKTRFDAFVTDLRMPEMSGGELLEHMRKLDPGLPLIVLSAFHDEDELRTARRDGLLAVLAKGQQLPKLLDVISRARRDGTVLVAEDDSALVDNLCEAFATLGLTVATVGNVSDIGSLAAQPFFALVDLKMPGGCFGAAVDAVRARFPGVPIVAMTAFEREATGSNNDVVLKPFDTGALLARIEENYRKSHP